MKKRVLLAETERKNVSLELTQKYVAVLKKMVDCKTVFTRDFKYKSEYDKFYAILAENFPKLHEKAERLTFGSGCFVFVIKGKNARKNVMIMSHHDVVDGDDKWETDPFNSVEKEARFTVEGLSIQKRHFLPNFKRRKNYWMKVMNLTE